MVDSGGPVTRESGADFVEVTSVGTLHVLDDTVARRP